MTYSNKARLGPVLAILGRSSVVLGVLVFLILQFVVVGDGVSTSDLLGFAIPEPPVWTSWIPYLGWVFGILFELLSSHGIIVLSSFLIPVSLGLYLIRQSEKQNLSPMADERTRFKPLTLEGKKALWGYLKKISPKD